MATIAKEKMSPPMLHTTSSFKISGAAHQKL